MFIYVGGGGWDQSGITYMYVYKNGICRVKLDAKIFKASFRSFCTIFHENTLLKTSRTRMLDWKEMGFKVLEVTMSPRTKGRHQLQQACTLRTIQNECFMVWGKR